MFEIKTTAELALGALTHDLGKFLERSHPPKQGLSANSLGLESTICPVFNSQYSHRHVLYTNEFFEENLFWPHELSPERIASLASSHHRPDASDSDQKLIAWADRLASGSERKGEDSSARIRSTKLLSPLSTVFLELDRDWSEVPRLALAPLAAAPFPDSPETTDLTASYGHLWAQFLRVWQTNQCPSPLGFVNRACATLEHFTSAIPSAVNARPDVSLFEHLKVTAALAVARRWSENSGEPFLLLAGSLNGIQKHIFEIKAGEGGLAKRLRARSFQVAAFAESIMFGLLRRLGLPLTQNLSLAGGRFVLLLPNCPESHEVIQVVKQEAAEWLYRHGALLSFNLAHLALSERDMQAEFPAGLEQIGRLLRLERSREAAVILQSEAGWREDCLTLTAGLPRSDEALCPACRQKASEGPDGWCESCQADRDLGEALVTADRLAFFADQGRARYPAPAGSFSLLSPGESPPAGVDLVAALNQTDLEAHGRQPLIARPKARYVPRQGSRIIEFSDLARQAQGQTYLGYLKLDVDNLGYIMTNGFGQDRSIARVAALSRSLEAFFSLEMEALLRRDFKEVYLVYAGGDDLAAIGPWNIMFDLAGQIRQSFRRYAGGNPNWSLSAGLAVAPAKTPVTEGMHEAERLLKAAKDQPGKDSVGAFSVSLTWLAFNKALEEAKNLLGWLEGGAVSSGQARRLLNYANMYGEFQRTRDTRYFEYAPLLARDLARNWSDRTEEQRAARAWAARLTLPGAEEMARLGFICRYALAAHRKPQKED